MEDRILKLLGVFSAAGRADDGRPNTQALCEASGVRGQQLSPGYSSQRRPETVRKIAYAAAGLLGLDASQLLGWLNGDDEPKLATHIDALARLRRCVGCQEWFDKGLIDRALCRCPTCCRSPGINKWIEQVDAKIINAPTWLQSTWATARAQTRAITYIRLAAIARREREEFRSAWKKAGLPDRPAGQAVKSMLHNRCYETWRPRTVRMRRSRYFRDSPSQIPLAFERAAQNFGGGAR